MEIQDDDRVRQQVRKAYGDVAKGAVEACGIGCCGTEHGGSFAMGYSAEDLASVPEGADLGLGCGNPQAIAALQPGESVIDLGSGGGFDCFLAAKQVGPSGRVVGVDMTPEMVAKARANKAKVGAENVDFRLGEIERMPVEDASADVILSNCVINLSPDKAAVFREAFRALKPGGRLAISDIVSTAAMPPALAASVEALTGCVAGAAPISVLRELLTASGFVDVKIEPREGSRAIIGACMPGAEEYVVSATIEARKPGGAPSCCAPSCCAPKGAST